MNGIWGLTESQFVTAYGVALAGAICWARMVRERSLRPGAEHGEGPALTTDELAYLAGGRRRAVQTSVARLLDTGALRVTGDGLLAATGRSAHSQLDMVVLDRLGVRSRTTAEVVDLVIGSPAVGAIRTRLVRLGLLVDPAELRVRSRHAVFPIGLLGAVGLWYWLEAAAEGQRIGWVTVALAITAVAAAITTRPTGHYRTLLGERTWAAAARCRPAKLDADHGSLGVSWSAARSVAIGGLAAYPDAIVRGLLLDLPVTRGSAPQTAADQI